jgi:2,2-dialkylglycine decarboxylase (pyruvate)
VGLELVDERGGAAADALSAAVARRCADLGLPVNIVQLPGMGATFRIFAPLTATDGEIDRSLAILDSELTDETGRSPWSGVVPSSGRRAALGCGPP